jgi:hypothetical protein
MLQCARQLRWLVALSGSVGARCFYVHFGTFGGLPAYPRKDEHTYSPYVGKGVSPTFA